MKLLIFGASGMGRELASWAPGVVGHIDNVNPGRTVNDLPVWGLDQAAVEHPDALVVVAVGDPELRERLAAESQEAGLSIAGPLVHRRAIIDGPVAIGDGTIICAGTVVTANVSIGRHVQVNVGCTLSHDTVYEDFVTLAPGVHISGKARLGRGARIGTGAVTVDGAYDRPLVIGEGAMVGAGAVVTKPVPPGETWAGVPARRIG